MPRRLASVTGLGDPCDNREWCVRVTGRSTTFRRAWHGIVPVWMLVLAGCAPSGAEQGQSFALVCPGGRVVGALLVTGSLPEGMMGPASETIRWLPAPSATVQVSQELSTGDTGGIGSINTSSSRSNARSSVPLPSSTAAAPANGKPPSHSLTYQAASRRYRPSLLLR